MTRLEIAVRTTWDGQSTPSSEAYSLRVVFDECALTLTIDAPYFANPPPASPPGACPGLWNFEVVELFLAWTDRKYIELEFGPHGHYLSLAFANVREATTGAPTVESYVRQVRGARWHGVARVLVPQLSEQPQRYNAFAIHGPNEARSYRAHSPLPGPKPDFHQPHRFPHFPLA